MGRAWYRRSAGGGLAALERAGVPRGILNKAEFVLNIHDDIPRHHHIIIAVLNDEGNWRLSATYEHVCAFMLNSSVHPWTSSTPSVHQIA